MDRIGVFDSLYSLMVYCILEERALERTVFIFGDNIKIDGIRVKNHKRLFGRENILARLVGEIYDKYACKKILKEYTGLPIYGQDHIRLGNKMVGMREFYVIEDGSENYMDHLREKERSGLKSFLVKGIKKILGINSTYGVHRNVNKVYLTGLGKIPKSIENKVEIVNLRNLWEKKSLEEKREILEFFSLEEDILKIDGGIMIFTQPLSEDGIISEERKIELYEKVMEKYSMEKIIIKTHPREKTDYKKIFPVKVLDKPVPFELLSLGGLKIDRAVTLFSTAALGIKDIPVDFYGTEVDENIFKRFGSCDKIMERNAYLGDDYEK